jgi:hypothetical protein
MEEKGARAGAGSGLPGGCVVGSELGGGGVEVVDVDGVEAEIVDEEEAIVGRDGDAMGVRGLLAVGVGSVAFVLLEGDGGAEVAVVAEREGGCAAAVVVCGEDGAGGVIDGDVAG